MTTWAPRPSRLISKNAVTRRRTCQDSKHKRCLARLVRAAGACSCVIRFLSWVPIFLLRLLQCDFPELSWVQDPEAWRYGWDDDQNSLPMHHILFIFGKALRQLVEEDETIHQVEVLPILRVGPSIRKYSLDDPILGQFWCLVQLLMISLMPKWLPEPHAPQGSFQRNTATGRVRTQSTSCLAPCVRRWSLLFLTSAPPHLCHAPA